MSILLASFVRPGFAQSATLTVAVAADLMDVEQPLSVTFQGAYPAWGVKFVTAASGVLTQQIENGAPYDVFLSANAAYLDRLVARRLIIKNSALNYAHGELGIIWRDRHTHPFTDLRGTAVRFVGLPNPKLAPYGVAAQQTLTKLGLWDSVRPKIVYGENVRQTWQLYQSGNADAVITSWSILYNRGGMLIDASLHDPIIQRGGILTSTRQPEAARRFMRFLAGPEGVRILNSHGLRAGAETRPAPARPAAK